MFGHFDTALPAIKLHSAFINIKYRIWDADRVSLGTRPKANVVTSNSHLRRRRDLPFFL